MAIAAKKAEQPESNLIEKWKSFAMGVLSTISAEEDRLQMEEVLKANEAARNR